MKKLTLPLGFGILALLITIAPTTRLSAQQNTPAQDQPSATSPGQQPPAQQQQPPDQTAPTTPGAQAQSQEQIFTGTIAKSGDKYVLQASSGKSYDIDHQELAQKYEGKQVRVKGTLDPDGKTIHVR